jgi:hypothetical protein
MSWPDTIESDDGYKFVSNKIQRQNSIWGSNDIDLQSCKAACNSTSRCKSIVYGNSNRNCYLKTWSERDGNEVDDSEWSTYYKQGEPAREKRMYITKPISEVPGKSWKEVESLYERNNIPNHEDSCEFGSIQVGRDYSGIFRKDALCTLIPRSSKMCPVLGPDTDNKDLRYFIHDRLTSDITGEISDYSTKFTQQGTRLEDSSQIRCGYNRIDKSKWPQLDTWFNASTKRKIIKEHCEGPGVTSKELAADSAYCGNSAYSSSFSKSEYYQAILNKLKSEPNWWNDATNCVNFQNIIVGNTSDQSVMRVAGELIDTLPNTGWSDNLVKAINAIKVSVSGALDDKLDDKSKAYCDASSGDTNSKCGCRNAIKYGKFRQCKIDIQGCPDVKRSFDLIDKAKGIDESFGNKLEITYDPKDDSEACKESVNPSSTILNIGNTRIKNTNIVACFNEIENSGTISGDVSTKCNATINLANSQSSSSTDEGESTSTSTSKDTDGVILKGETAGIKNDTWLIGFILCLLCFLVLGIGFAAVII